jgi:nickel transport protein
MKENNKMLKTISNKKTSMALFMFFLFWLFIPLDKAYAHRATIFAWREGNTVHTQSKLSGGKRVKGGEVIVYDSQGVQLLKGRTDDNGMFTFTAPQNTGLKIILNAGMGHRAEWSMPPEELVASDAESNTPEATGTAPPKQPRDAEHKATTPASAEQNNIEISRKDIENIIDKALDKKLVPVFDKMDQVYNRGPGLTEIIGGIGYIIGLVGVALIITNYRRKE